MKQEHIEARDKDIHCFPSAACVHNMSYDRCTSKEAPKPCHSRCIGSRICEEWRLN